jgi:hypothetical protein
MQMQILYFVVILEFFGIALIQEFDFAEQFEIAELGSAFN